MSREKGSKGHHLYPENSVPVPQCLPKKLLCLTVFLSLQTPLSWQELEGERASSCAHKRSASWGSTDHRKEVATHFDSLPRVAASSQSPSTMQCISSMVASHCSPLLS